MKTVNASLESFYGYGCAGEAHGSNSSSGIEVDDSVGELIDKLIKEGNTLDQRTVPQLIANGHPELKPLHEELIAQGIEMIEEYWLFEAYNEFQWESLMEGMESDLKSGLYHTEVTMEEFMEKWKAGVAESIGFDMPEYGPEEDEDAEYWYHASLLEEYYDWVCGHDNEFIGERVGCDLGISDDEVYYTIESVEDVS